MIFICFIYFKLIKNVKYNVFKIQYNVFKYKYNVLKIKKNVLKNYALFILKFFLF